MADYPTDTANGIGYPVPTPPTGVLTPSRMVPSSFTQARWFNVPEGGWDDWGLSSLTVHWKTGIGELVSSTSYFSRKVVETEDETDFVYAAITAGAGGEPQPSGITEEKDYQEFVQEVRFVSALQGTGAIRGRRLLFGHCTAACRLPPTIRPRRRRGSI